MQSYTLEEVIKDIKSIHSGHDAISYNHKTQYIFFALYSNLKEIIMNDLNINNIETVNDINKMIKHYFENVPKVPVGTNIPEGKELVLYEVYNINDTDIFKLFCSIETSNLSSLSELLKKTETTEFKSKKAVIMDFKNITIVKINIF